MFGMGVAQLMTDFSWTYCLLYCVLTRYTANISEPTKIFEILSGLHRLGLLPYGRLHSLLHFPLLVTYIPRHRRDGSVSDT